MDRERWAVQPGLRGILLSPAAFIRVQKQLLEDLFQEATLADPHARHPAAARWQMCAKLLRQGAVVRWPTQRDELPLITAMMLDASTFVKVSGGSVQTLSLGDLSGYGNAAVQRKIKSRLNDPSQFGDLMVELSMAAWHQFEGHRVTPFETEGWPDLRIDVDGQDAPTLLECKRVQVTTTRRIAKHITDANRQIKRAEILAYGVVSLDVTAALSRGPHPPSDEVPAEIISIVPAVKASLSGPKHRSVGRVVLTWDDVGLLGNPPDRSVVFLRRHFLNIDHEPVNGVRPLPESARTFQGITAVYSIDWDRSASEIEILRSSDLMTECRRWFSFTDEELVDAFLNRDKWQPLDLDEHTHFALFARRSTVSGKPSFILVLGGKADTNLNLQFAIRIPPRLYVDMDLLTPFEMLERLIADYGLDVTIGGVTARFVRRHRFELSGTLPSALSQVTNPENHSFLHSIMVKIKEVVGGYSVESAMVFALDYTKLLAELAA